MTKEEFITARTKIISDMLDNPDKYGIYPTTKCFNALDALFESLLEQQSNKIKQALGKIQNHVEDLRIKVYGGQSLEENEKTLYEIEQAIFKIMDLNENTNELEEKTITVCDKCLQASCWQGEFMCDNARTAGTTEKTIEELKKLDLENSSYWELNKQQ